MSILGIAIGPCQQAAIVVAILGYIFDWYGFLLLDRSRNNDTDWSPHAAQWYGLLIAVALGSIAWLRSVLAIQGDPTLQGHHTSIKR